MGGGTASENIITDKHCIDLISKIEQFRSPSTIDYNDRRTCRNSSDWQSRNQGCVNFKNNGLASDTGVTVLKTENVNRFNCQSPSNWNGENMNGKNESIQVPYSHYVNGNSNSADGVNKLNSFNNDVDGLGRPLNEFNEKEVMFLHELGWLQQWGFIKMACQHDTTEVCSICIHESHNDNRSQLAKKIRVTATNWYHGHYEYKLPVFHMSDAANWLNGFYVITSQLEDSVCIQAVPDCDRGELQIGPFVHWLLDLYPVISRLDTDSRRAARITYENYRQDAQYQQLQGCIYTTYMTKIIEELMAISDVHTSDTLAGSSIVLCDPYPIDKEIQAPNNTIAQQCTMAEPLSGFNDTSKTTGFLALQDTSFSFIGPDRPPVKFLSIDQYLHLADMILSTGLPNYEMARYPIQSELNIPAWEQHLQGYPDQRVLQYLKFGFPLSIVNRHELHNVEVKNHYFCHSVSQSSTKLFRHGTETRGTAGTRTRSNTFPILLFSAYV